MFIKDRELVYKGIGLNKFQGQIKSIFGKIMKAAFKPKQAIQFSINAAQLESFDQIIQKRLDEKLNFYFRWRLPVQFSENSQIFIHTNDGHRLYVDTKESFMALHLLEHGEWETPLRRELKKKLSPGDTFIDIGANIGLHTLYATSLIRDNGHVIALEPHPVTRKLLRKNLEINGLLNRVTVLPFAVSNEDDSIVPFEYFIEHPAMSGLKVSKDILENFNGTLEKIDVNTITVDTLVERYGIIPDVIKIDVEGFEYFVLEGCTQTIEKHKTVCFFIEYEKRMAESVTRSGIGLEIANFFKARKFDIYRVDDTDLYPLTYEQFSIETRGDYIFSR